MAKKRSTSRRQPPADPAPVRAAANPPVLEAARLPHDLSSRELVPMGASLLGVVVGYLTVLRGPGWADDHIALVLAGTVAAIGGAFTLERHVLAVTPRASLRFAGFGILAPILWYFLHAGALVPLFALQALTTYRLGLGSVTPPAITGTLLTGIVFGPAAGMVVCAGYVWPGIAVLAAVRRPGGAR